MKISPDLSCARWVKSSYSNGDGGACIEHAPAFAASGVVPVRDSKDPQSPVILFSVDGWRGFVAAVESGAFTR
ncbi:DUF397 domain-containing protein [Streptomyces sp. NPDC055078]